MDRCATCKWWEPFGPRNQWGDCQLTIRTEYGKKHDHTLAVVESPSSFGGEPSDNVLETHMTFGCVQYEPELGK